MRSRMMPISRTLGLLLALGLLLVLGMLLAGCGAARAGRPLAIGPVERLPRSDISHVVVVVMENAEYGDVIGNASAPYVNSLASRYGLATRSYAVAHPSLPNYIALTSGWTGGLSSDCTSCDVAGTNLADQLDAAGLSWKAYLEDLPRPCFEGAGSAGYAKKHNPFAYYRDIAGRPERCRRLVGFGALAADLRAGTLPRFSWITPNLCDDGHDCALRTADSYLSTLIPPLLHELGPRGFLVLTWDEGDSDEGCCGPAKGGHVATVLAGPDVRPGAREGAPLDSYGVLATIEQAFRLTRLREAGAARAGSLVPLFEHSPRLR